MTCAAWRGALLSDGVRLDADFSLRHVDRPRGPDLDRVHPRVLWMIACQRYVLLELKDRRPFHRNRNAVGSERDLLSVLSCDLGVDVELAPPISADVKVVDALDSSFQLSRDW